MTKAMADYKEGIYRLKITGETRDGTVHVTYTGPYSSLTAAKREKSRILRSNHSDDAEGWRASSKYNKYINLQQDWDGPIIEAKEIEIEISPLNWSTYLGG